MQSYDDNDMLQHLVGDEERVLGRDVADIVQRVLDSGDPGVTAFLSADDRQVAHSVIGTVPTVQTRAYGGYPRAARQRLVVYPEFYLPELLVTPVTAVQASGSFATPLAAPDVIASLSAVGIDDRDVGDVILVANGCQVVLAAEKLPFVLKQWTTIAGVPVVVEEIDLERLAVEPQRTKEIRTTVASLRLDALAAAGYGTSRTKMARDIKSERVKVNWQRVDDPAKEVKQGDVLSIKGRGRVHVTSVDGTTRKGRISILLTRFM